MKIIKKFIKIAFGLIMLSMYSINLAFAQQANLYSNENITVTLPKNYIIEEKEKPYIRNWIIKNKWWLLIGILAIGGGAAVLIDDGGGGGGSSSSNDDDDETETYSDAEVTW
jgi:hypothetical protein